MKRFAFESILLFMLILIVILSLEYKYASYKTPVDLIFESIEDSDASVNAIVVGNSHARSLGSFRRSDFNALNVSKGGQDLFHALLIIKYAIETMDRLQYVVLGLDADILGYTLVNTNQSFIDRQYYPYSDTLQGYDLVNKLMAKSNFFRSNRDFGFLLGEHNNGGNNNFIPVKKESSQQGCVNRATEHTHIKFSPPTIGDNEEILAKILSLCNANGIKVLAVNFPKKTCYVASSNQHNISAGINISNKLCGKFVNTKYLNMLGDTLFDDSDFLDYDHLNETGAIKMQNEIVTQITAIP